MTAGKYDQLIQFQSARNIQTGFGSELSWSDDFESWAKVKPETSVETFEDDHYFVKTIYTVKVPYQPQIDNSLRIAWNDKVLEIKHAQAVIEWRETILTCVGISS